MANKKTSDKNVTKTSPVTPKTVVAKSSKTAKPKTTATSSQATPARVKETTATKTAKKTVKPAKKAATETTNVPVKENKDVVSSVLEVKAKNEAKKAAKAVKTKVTVVNKGASADANIGVKVAAVRNKRSTLKVNAQKAETKKFMNMKEQTPSEPEVCAHKCCFISGIKAFFAAWVDGYRQMFNYRGRTNRYGFWAFMLFNLILVSLLSLPYHVANVVALASGQELPPLADYIYWGTSFLIMFVYLSLYVRRLHDAGYNAWKGFFRPMTYSILGVIVLFVIGDLPQSDDNMTAVTDWRSTVLGFGIIVLLLINLYYLCKTFIAAGFMEEENAENAYGDPVLLKDCGKCEFLRYATLYLIISIFYMIIFWSIQYYLSIMLLTSDGMY